VHIAIALALGVLGFVLIVLLAGASPFVGIVLIVFVLGIGAVWGALTARAAQRRLDSDVPSTREASYEPVARPEERSPDNR
jgi:hypothetical protein